MVESMGTGKSVVLSVGGDFHLRRGKDYIVYAGMPSDSVYSIVQKKASGYQGYAWSLYYPRKRQDIIIDGVNVFVEKVTPEDIELRVVSPTLRLR
ncbi:MAG: hypothetical protein A2144_12165 [Chloroflexi bacterium RBG_16_50_9]|nr:MAG: hypothetical protein A2144_12165 [Chloroflexi bacterium RBG_16_50_9]